MMMGGMQLNPVSVVFKKTVEYEVAEILARLTKKRSFILPRNGGRARMSHLLHHIHREGRTECAICSTPAIKVVAIDVTDRSRKPITHSIRFLTANGSYLSRDHIIPRSAGGSNHHENIQILCQSCNLQKNDTIPTNTTTLMNVVQTKVKILSRLRGDEDIYRRFKDYHDTYMRDRYISGIKTPLLNRQEARAYFGGVTDVMGKVWNEHDLVYVGIPKHTHSAHQ